MQILEFFVSFALEKLENWEREALAPFLMFHNFQILGDFAN